MPIVGDELYGTALPSAARRTGGRGKAIQPLALRAIQLDYIDPFSKRPVEIRAPCAEFVRDYGFHPERVPDSI